MATSFVLDVKVAPPQIQWGQARHADGVLEIPYTVSDPGVVAATLSADQLYPLTVEAGRLTAQVPQTVTGAAQIIAELLDDVGNWTIATRPLILGQGAAPTDIGGIATVSLRRATLRTRWLRQRVYATLTVATARITVIASTITARLRDRG